MESICVTAFKHNWNDQCFYMPHEMCYCLYVMLTVYYVFTMLFISQTFICAHLLCHAPVSSVNTQYYKEVEISEK